MMFPNIIRPLCVILTFAHTQPNNNFGIRSGFKKKTRKFSNSVQ